MRDRLGLIVGGFEFLHDADEVLLDDFFHHGGIHHWITFGDFTHHFTRNFGGYFSGNGDFLGRCWGFGHDDFGDFATFGFDCTNAFHLMLAIGSGAPYTFFIPWGRGKQWVGPTTPGRKFTYSKQGNEKEGKRQLFFYVETPRTDGFKPGRKVWSDLVRNRFDRVKIDFVNAIGSNIAREL